MTTRQAQLLAAEMIRHTVLAQLMDEDKLRQDHEEIAAAIASVLETREEVQRCQRSAIKYALPRRLFWAKMPASGKVKRWRSRGR